MEKRGAVGDYDFPLRIQRCHVFTRVRTFRRSNPRLFTWQHTAEAQMCHERIEIPVAVQQGVATVDASRRDDRVNRLADRNAQRPQRTVILRRLNGDIQPTEINDHQGSEQPLRLVEVTVAAEALQHLGQDEVAQGQRLVSQQAVEFVRLYGPSATEVVDPDTGINQNHLSALMASRSPCQFSLPRKRRISSCWRKRSTVRSPSSTASRLVFNPVARSASSINWSSITMCVRMVCKLLKKHAHSICGEAVLQLAVLPADADAFNAGGPRGVWTASHDACGRRGHGRRGQGDGVRATGSGRRGQGDGIRATGSGRRDQGDGVRATGS
ncbi:hypothetical protein ACCAA_1650001 [Candidatus Accumulibacter aalborgensis]|uniref:Uncharacterized protein n=1 Tax=Candidatus Accumulibacter aalborgensis TaxID=1860102 RepID=A0A1A8XIS8_9PROT|nr:hypothetical protein ACCAA_1650001 [Candidatus Accumulibacter aalborgensis]